MLAVPALCFYLGFDSQLHFTARPSNAFRACVTKRRLNTQAQANPILPTWQERPVVESVPCCSPQTFWGAWTTLLVCLFLSGPASAAKWSGTHIPKRSLTEAAKTLKSGASGASHLPMAKYPDPMLRMSARPVAESMFHQSALKLFTEALQTTAAAEGAVGLAASQVGVDARIIVLDPSVSSQTVFVNPQVVERSSEDSMRWWRERCLVLPPDVLVTLMRDARIKVHAFDLQGGSYTVTLEGEAARAFQHELDHLNGVLIIDHAVDDDDLTSQAFPQMKQLEEPDHPWRQEIAFARQVGALDETSGG
eukprot:s2078_g11.t1